MAQEVRGVARLQLGGRLAAFLRAVVLAAELFRAAPGAACRRAVSTVGLVVAVVGLLVFSSGVWLTSGPPSGAEARERATGSICATALREEVPLWRAAMLDDTHAGAVPFVTYAHFPHRLASVSASWGRRVCRLVVLRNTGQIERWHWIAGAVAAAHRFEDAAWIAIGDDDTYWFAERVAAFLRKIRDAGLDGRSQALAYGGTHRSPWEHSFSWCGDGFVTPSSNVPWFHGGQGVLLSRAAVLAMEARGVESGTFDRGPVDDALSCELKQSGTVLGHAPGEFGKDCLRSGSNRSKVACHGEEMYKSNHFGRMDHQLWAVEAYGQNRSFQYVVECLDEAPELNSSVRTRVEIDVTTLRDTLKVRAD